MAYLDPTDKLLTAHELSVLLRRVQYTNFSKLDYLKEKGGNSGVMQTEIKRQTGFIVAEYNKSHRAARVSEGREFVSQMLNGPHNWHPVVRDILAKTAEVLANPAQLDRGGR